MNRLRLIGSIAIAATFLPCLMGANTTNLLHPYHVSLAEMELNSRTGNFEVSLCVWPADLEKALSRMTEKAIDLDKTDELEKLIAQYLEKRISFRSEDGEQAKIRYVGQELDLQKGWLYFEVQTKDAGKSWRFENHVFFELNDDQINHFNLKIDDKLISEACTAQTRSFDIKP